LRQFLLQPFWGSVFFFFPAFSSVSCVSWPFVQAFLSTAEATSCSFNFPSLRILTFEASSSCYVSTSLKLETEGLSPLRLSSNCLWAIPPILKM
jgi:hypothetical protein